MITQLTFKITFMIGIIPFHLRSLFSLILRKKLHKCAELYKLYPKKWLFTKLLTLYKTITLQQG